MFEVTFTATQTQWDENRMRLEREDDEKKITTTFGGREKLLGRKKCWKEKNVKMTLFALGRNVFPGKGDSLLVSNFFFLAFLLPSFLLSFLSRLKKLEEEREKERFVTVFFSCQMKRGGNDDCWKIRH